MIANYREARKLLRLSQRVYSNKVSRLLVQASIAMIDSAIEEENKYKREYQKTYSPPVKKSVRRNKTSKRIRKQHVQHTANVVNTGEENKE